MRTVILVGLALAGTASAFAPLGAVPRVARRSLALSPSMAVARKDSYEITALPGDGIGPEIMDATKVVLAAVCAKQGFKINFTDMHIGGAALDATGDPFPAATLDQIKKSDSCLLAAIGGPKWDANPRDKRPETGLLAMRKALGLFANLRPAKVLPQLLDSSTLRPEVVEGVDIMVVRELTGDVYFGEPKGVQIVDGERFGFNNMCYKESEVRRIAKVAFDIAMKRGKKVHSIDKANVLDVSQLWRDVVIETHKEYPEVSLEHMYVDNAAMQLIKWPKQFDVMVTGNIFGDILSDEASMLVGSLGMLPSASVGD
ncbi:Isopropylmalate dehydrogenase-like domain-containing protein, partial [Baffinella frigidus]